MRDDTTSMLSSFDMTLFGQKLPVDIQTLIFSSFLNAPFPVLTLIQSDATSEQKKAVIEGKAYHVIKCASNDNRSTYSLGFAKKSGNTKNEKTVYHTVALPEDTVFYSLATLTPERLIYMGSPHQARDIYALYFLEDAIKKAGGLVHADFQNPLHLKRVCKQLNEFISETFRKEIQKKHFEIALQHLLFGHQNAVEQCVKANPELLCERTVEDDDTTDISGKPVGKNKTLLQAALCAGDIDMTKMLAPYFNKITDGKEKMKLQILEILPNAFSDSYKERKEHMSKQIKKAQKFKNEKILPLIHTILALTEEEIKKIQRERKLNSSLDTQLKDFRKEIQRLSFEDNIYNPYYLFYALKESYNNQALRNNCAKVNFFSAIVIGGIQRHCPACDLQLFTQGIYKKCSSIPFQLERNFKSPPLFSDPNPGTTSIHSTDTLLGLGFDYFFDFFGRKNVISSYPLQMTIPGDNETRAQIEDLNKIHQEKKDYFCNLSKLIDIKNPSSSNYNP